MDRGHELTDERIKEIEERLRREYEQAAKEIREKTDDYLRRFATKDKIWQKWVEDKKKTPEEYAKWRFGQITVGKRWDELKERIANDQLNVNKIARNIIQNEMPGIFALNANYAGYQVEHDAKIDTTFTLYSRDTVDKILRDDPDLLLPPGKKVSQAIQEGKAKRWEKQKIQSVMTQGILHGESIPNLASRLAKEVADSDYKAAVRNARTMSTNAQNAGRYDAYDRIKGNGVDLTLEWAATLDNRTRHEHRMMHGQRRDVGEPFEVEGIKIMYPAQTGKFMSVSSVPQEMIWNCRCTILAWVKGFEHDTITKSDKMGKMSFEEWLEAKERPEPILRQKEKGDAIRASYIRKYGGWKTERSESKETAKLSVPKFIPSETITDAEEFAMKFMSGGYKSAVNYQGIDLKYANEFNRAINDVLSQYDPKYKLRSVQPMNMRSKQFKGSTAEAAYQWGMRDLFFNKAYFKTVKDFAKHEKQYQDLMDTVISGVDKLIEKLKGQTGMAAQKKLDYAEALRDTRRATVGGADPYSTIVHELGHYLDDSLFRVQMKADGFDLSASYNKYSKGISAYATATTQEYVAESFAAYINGERENIDPDLINIFVRSKK